MFSSNWAFDVLTAPLQRGENKPLLTHTIAPALSVVGTHTEGESFQAFSIYELPFFSPEGYMLYVRGKKPKAISMKIMYLGNSFLPIFRGAPSWSREKKQGNCLILLNSTVLLSLTF